MEGLSAASLMRPRLLQRQCADLSNAFPVYPPLPYTSANYRVLSQRVGGAVESHFCATSLTLTIQVWLSCYYMHYLKHIQPLSCV